jgi:hypothetical protein
MLSDQPKNHEHYDVFISYSRKDHEFASQLEKTLNNYSPPKRLGLNERRLTSLSTKFPCI